MATIDLMKVVALGAAFGVGLTLAQFAVKAAFVMLAKWKA